MATTAKNPASLAAQKRTMQESEKARALGYDGFHGLLPKWVPPIFQKLFELTRNRISVDLQYKTAKCPSWIAAFSEDLARFQTTERPTMRGSGVPGKYFDDVEMLHWIKEAVSAGRQAGLPILLGHEPAKFIAGRETGSKNGGATRSDHARKDNQSIFEAAIRLRAKHPQRTAGQLAALIAKDSSANRRQRSSEAIRKVLERYSNNWT